MILNLSRNNPGLGLIETIYYGAGGKTPQMSRVFLGCMIAASLFGPPLAASQSTSEQPAATIHAEADLVVVDVVVADAKKKPVHGLAAPDFTIIENGHDQTIKSFEEHTSAQAASLPPLPKLEPGVFTNYSPTPTNGALNILLFDTLNTPMQDQSVLHDQVLKYLKEARPGTRMAIFGLNTQLRLLQGFTSDPELLRAVLNGKKGLPKGSPLMNDPASGDQPGADDPMLDMVTEAFGNSPSGATVIANLQLFEAEQQSFQLQLRARYTLEALNQLGRYLSSLPGRKNLIWFSGSFPINIMPDGDLQNPFSVVASAEDEFRETTQLFTRGQVAVYPIDARGLMTLPMMSASNSGKNFANNPNAFGKASANFFNQTANEHATMRQMAEATGGEAFVNTNGLAQAVEKAVEAGSNYYTLSYAPTNREWKGDYRKIQIKTERQGLTLAYRRGYYADDPRGPVHRGESKDSTATQAPYDPLRAAMLRGGPEPTEIVFGVSVRPSSAATDPNLAPGNQAEPKTTGPYRRYSVLFFIPASAIACTAAPNGVRQCLLDTKIFVYDADGALLNSQNSHSKIEIPASRLASILKNGINLRQEISVPVKGESFIRIGLLDQVTNRLGAVELPVAAVSKLAPLDTPAPAPAFPPK